MTTSPGLLKNVYERRRSGREGMVDGKLKDVIPHPNDHVPTKENWWKFHQKITAREILKATAGIRRTTAGGLNGVTPWQYKKAIESSPSNSLANTLASLANRIGKGHFNETLGATWAAGRLIPLIQEETDSKTRKQKLKIRPIIVGDTVRRIIVRAYSCKVQEDINAICGDHQLNVIKGGYDVGIHAARAELKRSVRNGNCALKVDFKNAFNSIRRTFFLELIAAWTPQLLPFAWLYYASESNVFSNEATAFSSEEGAQQGDHIGNWAFSVVAKFINDRLQNLDFALKQFFVDDLFLIADLDTIRKAIKIIREIEDLTGVKINHTKTTLYCPNQTVTIVLKS